MSGLSPTERGRTAPAAAAEICELLYFRPARVDRLDGYEDANFRVEDSAGRRFVLKLSRGDRDPAPIGLELRVLSALSARDWPGVPRPIGSRNGRVLERVDWDARPLRVRLLSWIDGTPLAHFEPHPGGLFAELGRFLGRLDDALAEVEVDGERSLDWDLARLAEQRRSTALVEDGADRRRVENAIDDFLERRQRLLPRLRRGLIHNDVNDHNILVTSLEVSAARLAGLIDFGDLVVTETVYEPAIAAAYLGLGAAEPWSAVQPLLAGYHEARPLSAAELEMLLPAVRARLALSLTMAARRRQAGTADAYALVSESAARAGLRYFSTLDSGAALASLGAALGEGAR